MKLFYRCLLYNDKMTDNSVLIGNAQALTSDVRYGMKPSSVRCRSYRASVPSSNKTVFAPQDTAQLFIPARRNAFLDTKNSFMRFTLKNNNANNAIYVDGTGASIIQRLDVYHGSNMLESVQDYGVLMSYLTDFQLNTSQRAGLETAYGTTSNRQGVVLAGGGTVQKTFCMPILSGVVGCLNEKMLPLSLADDVRLEVSFATNTLGVVQAVASETDWSVINLELELNILELSDEGMRMVESFTPFTSPIYMHGTSFRHFSSTLANNSEGQQSMLVPARYASLKNLICLPRRSTEITSVTSHSLSSRVNPNIETYWWRIGSLVVPQKAVTLKNGNTTGGYGEAFIELLRSWNNISSPEFSSSVTAAYYNKANTVDATSGVAVPSAGATSYQNAFAISTELENISNRSDTILSGTNTLNSQIFFEYTNNTAVTAAYTLDFFANYDHILTLDPFGQLSVRF